MLARFRVLSGSVAVFGRKRKSPQRRHWMSRRPLHEVLEARHMLTATDFTGNECAPDLNLTAITPRSAVVGQPITLNLPALGATLIDEDAEGNPSGDVLRWLADPDTGVDFPTGATLTPAGVFTWTPTAAQMGQHVITIIGIDAGTPALADAETFIINVGENMSPNLAAIADQNATVGQELVVNITATDPNPGQTLTFAFDPDNAPASATIEKTGDATARIRWTPTAANVSVPVNFSVLVTDNGTPQLSDSESFSVTVTAPNSAPDLAAIADQEATVGVELVVNVTATDADAGQTLTFALDLENSPAGATITKTGATTATIRWTPAAGDVPGPVGFRVLVADDGITPLADAETLDVTVAAAVVGITSISPAAGEEMVNPKREAIVHFDGLIDPETLTAESFYVIANSAKVPGRVVVSSTERFATYFYDSPLPPSTEIRVVVDGSLVTDQAGEPIDADGDALPGGIATADFRTLPLTRIPGTNVFGFVRDSATGEPLVGVTIRVDAFPGLEAVTVADNMATTEVNEAGRFELVDVPAPEFFVTIDGSTVPTEEGLRYPTLGKPFHSIPGLTTQLNKDGMPFDIYLPLMAMGDIQALSATEATEIGFGEAGKARLAEMFPTADPALFDLMKVNFAPGSARDDAGNPATEAVVIPVAPNRIPVPLPATLNPSLVFSVQAGIGGNFNSAGGATNFDVPAQVSVPNLDGLPPGEKVLLFSFDHDAGKWVVNGTATVSDDGRAIVSDPGVGIEAPGWHLVNPGTDGDGDEPNDDPEWEDIAKTLNDDYAAKVGTKDAALAHQIACISGVACDNSGDDGWGDGWVREVFKDIAQDTKEGRYNTPLPEWVPNFAQAIWGGFGHHFFEQLLPSFIKNCDLLDSDSNGDGISDHKEFFENAVVPCFDMVRDAGELGSIATELAQFSVPIGATILRETVQAYCAGLDAFQNAEDVIDYARELFNAGVDLLEYGGELYEDLQDIIDRVDSLIDPLRDGIPLPHLSPSNWLSPSFSSLSDFAVETTTEFFMGVGETYEFVASSLFDSLGLPSNELTSSLTLDDVEYAVLADPSIATIDASGRLAVHNTNSPFRNIAMPLYIAARNGDQIAFAAFAVRDADSDMDGLVDSYERSKGLNPFVANSREQDSDNDGISDYFEAALNSSPMNSDTDRDGKLDGDELMGGGDLLSPRTNLFAIQSQLYFLVKDIDTGDLVRGLTSTDGTIGSLVLRPNTNFELSYFDPTTSHLGKAVFQTPSSGQSFKLPTVMISEFNGTDEDEDRLPDAIEEVLGTLPDNPDTDGDGISDSAELEQGLSPLDGIAATTGVQASLDMPGTVEALATVDDLLYAATGSHGLAIVDTSSFRLPIQLGQIDLPGNATGVGVEASLGLAAVASGTALHIVDVSDPMMPELARSVSVGANHVEVAGGFAFATSGNGLSVVDLITGDVIASLPLPGAGNVTGLAREGTTLYAYISGSDTLAVVDVSKPESPTILGQTSVDVASSDVGISAGGGLVWLAGSGLRTVDVSDPTNPTLQHGADSFFSAARVARNGSGLALVLPDGGSFVQVYNVGNPDDTDALLTQFNLSGSATAVAISRGIGFVGAGSRLEVVNYRPFDAEGNAPTAMAIVDAEDADPAIPGIQALEGGLVSVQAIVTDDVQVRNVELLINGAVVANDVSFPFDFIAPVPMSATGETFTIEVRATDTGGNATTSAPTTLAIVPDTFAPTIDFVIPANGTSRFFGSKAVRIRFNEPLDASLLAGSTFSIVSAGANGTFGDSDDTVVPAAVSVRDNDQLVQITATDNLPVGSYRVQIDETTVFDRAGNPLGDAVFHSEFMIVERPSVEALFELEGESRPGAFVLEGSEINLGIAVDGSFIGAGVGLEFAGTDFLEPGTPLAGYTIAFNGTNYTNSTPSNGSDFAVALQDLSEGSFHGMLAEGVIDGKLRVERVAVFNDGEQFITIAIRLTNIGDTDLMNVAFLENHDPDQGTPIGVGSNTNNDVVLDGELALASVVNDDFLAGLTMGFGSAAPLATVSLEQFFVGNPFDVIDTPEDPSGASGDTGLNIAFDFAELAPGESVTAAFPLVLGRSIDEAIAVYQSTPFATPPAGISNAAFEAAFEVFDN
jgi:hypothetical protein